MYRWLLLILTLGALSVPGRSAALDERAPDWDVMLKHFQLLADNYNAMIRDRRGSILKQFGEYDRILTFTENQSAKFDFLLDSYGDTGGFEALMRCRQISDLKQQFDDYLLQLERNCEILSDALERLKRLKADLEEDFNTASAAPFQAQLRQCLTAAERLENEFASLLKESQAYLKKFTGTARKVDALNTLAEQKRRQIVDGIFMKRGISLWERIRNWGSWSGFRTGIREIFTLWRLNLTNWLELRIPTTGSFWARLLTIFLAIAIPVVPLGRRLIYPWFNRLAVIHEDEVSRGWFSAGLLLGSATAALWCAPGWLNGSDSSFIETLTTSFSAFTMLVFSIAFRLKVENARRSMELYVPVVIQHLIGAGLYLALAPFDVLQLVVIPVNLLVALSVAMIVCRRKLDWIDLLFGVATIAAALLAVVFAAAGQPYLGFTVTLGWLLVIARIQVTLVLTRALLNHERKKPGPQKKILINNLLLPLLWIWSAVRIFLWVTATYYVQESTFNWMGSRISLPQDLLSITPARLAGLLIAALVLRFVLKSLRELVHRKYDRRIGSGFLASVLTLGAYLAWVLFALTGLMLMEAKYSSLLVMLGGLSMGVGLALKSSLENCLAALTILAGQLVRNGDYIEVDGIYGCVRKIGFRSTVMETEEGAVLTIPNTQLVDSKFLNWTRSNPLRRVELLVDVAYNSDLAKVTELLRKVVANTEGVQSFPVPEILCRGLEASSIRFAVFFWAAEPRWWQTQARLRCRVLEIFRENGIEIPFNQLDVTVKHS
jgi:mscS mechanosensitive ion channel